MTSAALKQAANEYQGFTKTTAVYPGSTEAQGLAYVTLGLNDEVGEFIAKLHESKVSPSAAIDEAGDVYWYAARICDHLDLNFGDVVYVGYDGEATVANAEYHATQMAAIIAGRVKKIIRDGELWTEEQRVRVEGVIVDALGKLLAAVNAAIRVYGALPVDVMHANREKLSDRKGRNVLRGEGDNR